MTMVERIRPLRAAACGVLGAAAAAAGATAAEPIVVKNCAVEYRRDTLLGASDQGVLQELGVRLGDAVAAGQVLGRLQDGDLRAALEVDRAAAESQVAVQKNEAQYAERLERLRQTDLLRARDATTSFEQRMARLEAESARLDVEDARAQRRLAQLRVQQTEAQLRLREVTSPHAGVVVEILKEPGESINVNEPVLRMADVAWIRVTGQLDVADAWRVRPGQRAALRPDVPGVDLPVEARPFAGEVVFVDPQIDPNTQTCRVVAEVANPDGTLRAGITGQLEVDVDGAPPTAPSPGAAAAPPPPPAAAGREASR
jgi:RND family efflux transporter MFP subunit